MARILRRQGVRQAFRVLGLAMVTAVGAVPPAAAQLITRWLDANGIVHFTTSSPPPGVKYEMLDLPATRAAAPAPPIEAAVGGERAPVAAPAAEPAAAANGTARVVLKKKGDELVGPSAREFRGTVKNVGGEPATEVSVRVSVLEDGQGNDCLQDILVVDPPTLRPGETGTYSAVLESPCFFGRPRIDLTPRWQQAAR